MTRARIVAAGMFGFAGLVVALFALTARPEAVFAGRTASSPVSSSGQLVTLTTPLGDHGQQLVVIEPELQSMCVYHIDSAGGVTLKSARNIHWDLLVEHYNGTSPLPRDIRSQNDHP